MSERDRVYYQHGQIDLRRENCSWSYMASYVGMSPARVLDVGCACGDFGLALKNARAVRVCGMEYNSGSIEVANATGAYETIVQCDLDALKDGDFNDWNGKFDYLICGDVLEHLRDPENALRKLLRFLKPEGRLIASVPNVANMYIKAQLLANRFDYTESGLLDQTHVHLFTRYTISEIISNCGFGIADCKFTMCDKNGWQKYDPWAGLTYFEKDAIFRDWHSYVCQYVFMAEKSKLPADELFQSNFGRLDINQENAPDYILNYSAQMQAECGVSPMDAIAAERDRIVADRDRILNSHCWRMTAPIRFMGDIVKKIWK